MFQALVQELLVILLYEQAFIKMKVEIVDYIKIFS